MNVAFCINRLALIGLGVTVSSLVRNCANTNNLTLWFICSDLSERDKVNIGQLLSNENFKGHHHFIDSDAKARFGHLRSLHGDWTPYSRLLLPELLKDHETVLYLDADLVVEVDVLELSKFELGDSPIAAVLGAQIKQSLENRFLIQDCKLDPDDPYFNSGALLMNLSVWRSQNIGDICMKQGEKYSNELLAADQTILNSLFSKSFKELPKYFNCPWYPNNQRPLIAQKMVLHFVGSPKPWDIGGSILHSGYKTWVSYLDKSWNTSYGQVTQKDFIRAWKIRRSYLRLIKKKFKNRPFKLSI